MLASSRPGDPHPPGPLPVSRDCCIVAPILLLSHSSSATSLFSETSKSQRNRSHPASDKEGPAPEDTDGIGAGRRLPGHAGWEAGAAHSSAEAGSAAVRSEQAGACPGPGLSLGSGEEAERGQLCDGSQEWAPETIPEDSGLKDNPQCG